VSGLRKTLRPRPVALARLAFHSFDKKPVLAYNLYGCSTGGDIPFFGECICPWQSLRES
jgi:hypothetical protein